MRDDVLWMGEIEAVVNEVDPIRGFIKVTLANNVQVDVGPEELERKRPEPQKVSTRKKRRIPVSQESTPAPSPDSYHRARLLTIQPLVFSSAI